MKVVIHESNVKDVAAALQLIEEAQMRLYAATRFLSRVPGLASVTHTTCVNADHLKKGWHIIEQAARTSSGASCNRNQPRPPDLDC